MEKENENSKEGGREMQTLPQFKINIPENHSPKFANSVQVNVTNEEVVLQFLFVRPNTKNGTLVSEVVLTPQHAMRLQKSLDQTLKKHFTKNIPA